LSAPRPAPPSAALDCVGVLARDAEAEVLSSLFAARGVPLLIQGRNHRRMLGVLGGGYVPLRLLVPAARAAEGRALLEEYRARASGEGEGEGAGESESAGEGADEGEGGYLSGERPPRLRLFTPAARRLSLAALLSALLGFGAASLSVGAWLAAPAFALAQLAALRPDLAAPLLAPLGLELTEGARGALSLAPALDLAFAAAWLALRGRRGARRAAGGRA